jgi:inward rectifier potassium channel
MASPYRTPPPPTPAPSYRIETVGAPRTPLRDAYHAFLRIAWWQAIGLIVCAYLLLNALFAGAYVAIGGIHDAAAGSFIDAYYFSAQTLGTIGYGDMYPMTRAANAVVVVESITGLIVMALMTGLVFSKFARTTSRMVFARRAVISPVDGVPTLMIRLGNERGNSIIDSRVRVSLGRTEHTREGQKLYRTYDLRLVRDHMQQLSRAWMLMHVIDESSPLFGKSPEDLVRTEVELLVGVVGMDDTTMQAVHAQHRYLDGDLAWGARYADILSEPSPELVILDLRKFHDVEPTVATADFPHPRA